MKHADEQNAFTALKGGRNILRNLSIRTFRLYQRWLARAGALVKRVKSGIGAKMWATFMIWSLNLFPPQQAPNPFIGAALGAMILSFLLVKLKRQVSCLVAVVGGLISWLLNSVLPIQQFRS